MLRYDNERALKSLVKQMTNILHEEAPTPVIIEPDESDNAVMHENPPSYDSQSGGGTEVGVKLVRGLFRTVRLCLESRVGKYYTHISSTNVLGT